MRISRLVGALLATSFAVVWWVALWRLFTRPDSPGLLEALALVSGWGLVPVSAVRYEDRVTLSSLLPGRTSPAAPP
ncbi:hypothetical protein [Streptomyces gobiensis]|uniref:hypothetical protein n=1 Tax=Streptomyces gobiensis TaxID=2875706 RepID=UPI001E53656B|nr:hypothetical protein [Streptomyces gobiensis]UGY93970.1 hypothetical protein test1122_21150 [Streptomyces gobiensis]